MDEVFDPYSYAAWVLLVVAIDEMVGNIVNRDAKLNGSLEGVVEAVPASLDRLHNLLGLEVGNMAILVALELLKQLIELRRVDSHENLVKYPESSKFAPLLEKLLLLLVNC